MDALPESPASPERRHGMLANNIVHFARTLRTAGLRVGPGQVLRAVEAVEAAGLKKRDDFYWTLHSVFVNRRDQREIFDQAFHVYWRNPRLLEKMMEMLLPSISVPADPDDKKQLSRRLEEALEPRRAAAPPPPPPPAGAAAPHAALPPAPPRPARRLPRLAAPGAQARGPDRTA